MTVFYAKMLFQRDAGKGLHGHPTTYLTESYICSFYFIVAKNTGVVFDYVIFYLSIVEVTTMVISPKRLLALIKRLKPVVNFC